MNKNLNCFWFKLFLLTTFKRLSSSKFIVSVCFILLVSCSTASGPTFEEIAPSDYQSIIYIYKVGSFRGSALSWNLSANGKPITIVTNKGYFPYIAGVGNVTFSAKIRAGFGTLLSAAFDSGPELISINVEPNKSYFVKVRVGSAHDLVPELVPIEQGLHEIKNLSIFKTEDN
ncbi:hypothetical protein DSCO28_70250 [Desulfosarcina ovata subsp. sediminis]|uniref:DUF2846 domain-containing protein n=1 Tax=Desulfosarcina ovata subsp. sediminis TaxID=885957 RepID=A0A5K8A1N2_9BACT|nr:hypothetical protein [Desulfosarcina ovata]BBO86459.1 hypothetical protein DSCO28_70250 [Desulfosarcina ovata subsp. sediminis]